MNMHAVFDIGNVLVHVNLEIFIDTFNNLLAQKPEYKLGLNAGGMVFLEHLQPYNDIGLTTVERTLALRFPYLTPRDITDLMDAWYKTITPNEMMLNFIKDLKFDGVKIALLSNIGFEHRDYLKNLCPDLFNNTIEHFSCEVGARKPNKIYFQSFLTDHGDFSGAVYLDDRPENLKAGESYTFKSYKFDLDEITKLTKTQQRLELLRVKSYIFDRKYNKPSGI